MARPSDREYALKRKIKELEEQNKQKDTEITRLKKQIEKLEHPEDKPKKAKHKVIVRGCPTCGKEIKTSVLPFGKLEICSAGCGWRRVEND